VYKRQLKRSGARVNGMENRSEPWLNVVRTNKPKVLTGLGQKGMW
jgi:hypothetical protein